MRRLGLTAEPATSDPGPGIAPESAAPPEGQSGATVAGDRSATPLEMAFGHRFADADLLDLALQHRSYAAELRTDRSYERLEFLGDAVLQLAVTDYLYESYPDLAEGEMAKVRAAVVDAPTLASLARDFGVGPALKLGRGEEQTGGRGKDSILADVVEALLGAVYMDAGFPVARDIVLTHWRGLIDQRAASPGRRDYKTRLQERLAASGKRPRYVITEHGLEHAKQFAAEVWQDSLKLGEGTGTSKKRAEQDAARDATARLDAADA
jgi:ribonuclease-3